MIINKTKSRQIAEILLNINAVKLQPYNFFTWSSGKKSPIYCDNRLLLSHVKERKIITNIFAELIQEKFKSIDYIAGVATGAIAHGMMIAEQLKLPFIYVRSRAKEHGRKNQIEGELRKGSKVLVIEDLISTGQSSLSVIKTIQEQKSYVIGLVSIFDYGFFNSNEINMPFVSLCNYNSLIELAIEKKIINQEQKKILFNWQKTQSN